jgi:FKBP-type peptidyl-prolyl cis-trans isomerase
MQYGEKELNYDEFKAGIDYVMNMSTKAKEEGEKFLAENAKREGVKTTASGLQYEVLEGTLGQKPKATDTVRVHYEGTLIDGTVFDSSYKRGESISFPLNGVIKGWTEGLQLMSIGSKYKLYIPYQLAYGERGAGASIPPYAALIFTVELLGIE